MKLNLHFLLIFILPFITLYCTENNTTRILVFTKMAGYKHESTPAAYGHIKSICEQNGIQTDSTSASEKFTREYLAQYDAVVFLNTSGDVLSEEQQNIFIDFIHAGKGFVGIHGASTTEYDWPWFGRLIGNYFDQHPEIQPAIVRIIDNNHISTRHLPAEWQRTDEWYNFRMPLATDVTVLAIIDEQTYQGGTNGPQHPFSWYHEFENGRSWYTAGGHAEEHYKNPLFIQHLLGGIQYASRND